MNSFLQILKVPYFCLIILVFFLALILGMYVLICKGNISLKVIIPFSCLILGIVICAVVVGCKTSFDMNQTVSDSTTVVIVGAEENSKILEDESNKTEDVKTSETNNENLGTMNNVQC